MVVEVRIKNMKNEDVKVDIQDTSLSVTAKLAVGNNFYNILGTHYAGTGSTGFCLRYQVLSRLNRRKEK